MVHQAEIVRRAVIAASSYAGSGGDANNPNGDAEIGLVPVLLFLINFIIFFPIWIIVCCLPWLLSFHCGG